MAVRLCSPSARTHPKSPPASAIPVETSSASTNNPADVNHSSFEVAVGILTEDMKRVVTEQRLAFVATVCPDGTPNLLPKGTSAVHNPFAFRFMHGMGVPPARHFDSRTGPQHLNLQTFKRFCLLYH